MMTLELSIVADVFRHEAQAKHALEALRQAGFGYDQIGIAMQGHEGIDLQSDLQNLGVPPEQASYYAQEVKAGYTVVSVRPDGREQEAHEIMRQSGAFTETDDGVSQTSNIDKQKAAWDQAVASHQVYLAAQLAANTQEDFHRPRSLKPRLPMDIQLAQAEEASLTTEPKPSVAPVVQQEEVSEQKSTITPIMQQEDVTEKKSVVTPILQNDATLEQSPLIEEHHETISIDDEETLRRLRNDVKDSAEVLSSQTQLDQPKNRNLVRNGALFGGLLLGLGTGIVVALLQREQIRKFVFSTVQKMKVQGTTGIRRNRNNL